MGKDMASSNLHEDIAEVIESHRERFLGFLLKRLRNRADAEDVLQAFCLRVLEKSGQLREAERMDAWLYAVLRSVLNDHRRKEGRRNRAADAFGKDPSQHPEKGGADAVEFCACVGGLLGELREVDADLIRKVDLEGEDRSRIAADLGLNRGALAVRLHRARVSLRDALLAHCGACCEMRRDDCGCASGDCAVHPSGDSSSSQDKGPPIGQQ